MYRIGVDIGGGSIKLGIVDEDMRVIRRSSVPFIRGDYEYTAGYIADAAETLAGGKLRDILSIGLCVPGSIDRSGHVVRNAYNLGFKDMPLYDLMKRHFPHTGIAMANDADAAALAELKAGALRGCASGVCLTLGTGLGCGLIINGAIYTGGKGLGCELGHVLLHNGGRHCTCGNDGCAEAYCSASALARSAGCADAREAVEAAKRGEERAVRAFEEYTEDLGAFCASIYNALAPEAIVIGGGLSAAGDFLFEPVRASAYSKIFFEERCPIVPAETGNDAGIIGAAML